MWVPTEGRESWRTAGPRPLPDPPRPPRARSLPRRTPPRAPRPRRRDGTLALTGEPTTLATPLPPPWRPATRSGVAPRVTVSGKSGPRPREATRGGPFGGRGLTRSCDGAHPEPGEVRDAEGCGGKPGAHTCCDACPATDPAGDGRGSGGETGDGRSGQDQDRRAEEVLHARGRRAGTGAEADGVRRLGRFIDRPAAAAPTASTDLPLSPGGRPHKGRPTRSTAGRTALCRID